MNSTEIFFQKIKSYDMAYSKDLLDWYENTKKTNDGQTNTDFINDVKNTHDLSSNKIADCMNIHRSSLHRPIRSTLLLRFCDAFNIPFQYILKGGSEVPKATCANIKCYEYTLTAYLQFSAKQAGVIIKDFLTYLGYTTSQLANKIGTNYQAIYKSPPSPITFDQLCIAYDLRGSNFKYFIEYLRDKQWFNIDEILHCDFIQELIAYEPSADSLGLSVIHSMIDDFLGNQLKRPKDKTYSNVVKYSEIREDITQLICFFSDNEKYTPLINKDDLIVAREVTTENDIKENGLYIISSDEQYINNEFSYIYIEKIKNGYVIDPPSSIFKPKIVEKIKFTIVAQVVLIIKADYN